MIEIDIDIKAQEDDRTKDGKRFVIYFQAYGFLHRWFQRSDKFSHVHNFFPLVGWSQTNRVRLWWVVFVSFFVSV